jgi:hypothetical protein
MALKFDDVLLEIADGPAELEKANEAALTEILDVGLRASPPLGYLRLRPIPFSLAAHVSSGLLSLGSPLALLSNDRIPTPIGPITSLMGFWTSILHLLLIDFKNLLHHLLIKNFGPRPKTTGPPIKVNRQALLKL